MPPEILSWGAPAYLAYLVFKLGKPIRMQNGWDFVASVAVFGIILVVASNLLYEVLHSLFPSPLWLALSRTWRSVLPGGSIKVALAFLVFLPVGYFSGTLLQKLHPLLNWIGQRWACQQEKAQLTNLFFSMCHDLLGKLVIITLTSGRVYVGILLRATDDPNEAMRFVKILPVMSGKLDHASPVFDYDYIGNVRTPQELPNQDILISIASVESLAAFDPKPYFIMSQPSFLRA